MERGNGGEAVPGGEGSFSPVIGNQNTPQVKHEEDCGDLHRLSSLRLCVHSQGAEWRAPSEFVSFGARGVA